MRLPDFQAWAVFACVAERRSFSAAAAQLGVAKATVSKAIARLEIDTGSALFHRTSRRLTLSDSGQRLLGHAQRILAEGEAAEAAAHEATAAPSGLVRMTAPMSFGTRHVAPLVGEFLAAHPGISIDLHLDDSRVDIIGEGFDLALRIARLPDSSLRVRRLCDVHIRTIASPAYLAAAGTPRHPAELGEHRCISYALAQTPETWRYRHSDGREAAVRVAGPLHVNNGDAMLPALCAGIGIGQLPDFLCDADIAAGRLTVLFPDWGPAPLGLHLISPPSPLRPRRVTALADFLAARLAG